MQERLTGSALSKRAKKQARKQRPTMRRLNRARLNAPEETLLRYISIMPEITLDCALLQHWQVPIEKSTLDSLSLKRLIVYDSDANTVRMNGKTAIICRDALEPNQENCAMLLRTLAGDTEDLGSGLIFQNIPNIKSIYLAVSHYIQGASEDITALRTKTVRELSGDFYRVECTAIFRHWLAEYKTLYGPNSAPVAHLYLHWGESTIELLYLEKALAIYQSLDDGTAYQLEIAGTYAAIARHWMYSYSFKHSAQGEAAYHHAYQLFQCIPQPILKQEKNLFLLYEALFSCNYLYAAPSEFLEEMETLIHAYQASYGNTNGNLALLYFNSAFHYYNEKKYLHAQFLYHEGLSVFHRTPNTNKDWLTRVYPMLSFVALDDGSISLAQQYNELAYYARSLYAASADGFSTWQKKDLAKEHVANTRNLFKNTVPSLDNMFADSFTSYDIQGELHRLEEENPIVFAAAKHRLQQAKQNAQSES